MDEYCLVSQIIPIMIGNREVNTPIVYTCVVVDCKMNLSGDKICKIKKIEDIKEFPKTGNVEGDEIEINMSSHKTYFVRLGDNYGKPIEFIIPSHN